MAKFNFILYPGYIWGIGRNNLYVNSEKRLFLREVTPVANAALNPGGILLEPGYVITHLHPCVRFSINATDPPEILGLIAVDCSYGLSSPYVWSAYNWFLHGQILDFGFRLYDYNYRGSDRYICEEDVGSSMSKFSFDKEFKYTNSFGKSVIVKLFFPCWYSPQKLGEYKPLGGATGTIKIGTLEKQEDGSEKLVEGHKTRLVYLGSLPVWK